MKIINADVKGQKLTVFTDDFIVSNSENYLKIKFAFNEEWGDLEKTVCFNNGKDKDFVYIQGDVVIVPKQILGSNNFSVSVYGFNDSLYLTTNKAYIALEKAGTVRGKDPEPPNPAVYEQLINLAKDTKQIAEKIESDAANGAFDGLSIVKVEQNSKNHLIITLSDGTINDAGYVKGTKGDKGDTGEQGISITDISVNAQNHLIIALTNGSVTDCGLIASKAEIEYLRENKQDTLTQSNIGNGLSIDDNGLPCVDENVIVTHDTLGIAFNNAYEDINKKADKSEVSNAIKGTVTGTTIRIEDVSPIPHKVFVSGTANVYGKNLCNIFEQQQTNPKGTFFQPVVLAEKNILNVKARNANAIQPAHFFCDVGEDNQFVVSGIVELGSSASTSNSKIYYYFTDDITNIRNGEVSGTLLWHESYGSNFTKKFTATARYFVFEPCIQLKTGGASATATMTITDLQVEIGKSKSDYEPFEVAQIENNETESKAGCMTIVSSTNEEVTTTYNRDANKLINQLIIDNENLKNAVIALGGSI